MDLVTMPTETTKEGNDTRSERPSMRASIGLKATRQAEQADTSRCHSCCCTIKHTLIGIVDGDEEGIGKTFRHRRAALTNHLAEIHSSWHMKEKVNDVDVNDVDVDDDDARPRSHSTHNR